MTEGYGIRELPPHEEAVRFEVLKAWKGVVGQEIVVANPTDDCGFRRFMLGREYVVWADQFEGRLQTSGCSFTSSFDEARNHGSVGFLDQGPPEMPIIGISAVIAGGILAAAILGWTLFRDLWRHVRPPSRGTMALVALLVFISPTLSELVRRGAFSSAPAYMDIRTSFIMSILFGVGPTVLVALGFIILGSRLTPASARWRGLVFSTATYFLVGIVWWVSFNLAVGYDPLHWFPVAPLYWPIHVAMRLT